MLNSQSWKSNSYIIHEPIFFKRFFNINYENVKGYCNFILVPRNLCYNEEGIETQDFKVIPFNHIYEVKKYFNDVLNFQTRKARFIKFRDRMVSLDKKNLMVIINATPDSFYPGSRISNRDPDTLMERMKKLNVEIVDIGGESTRPGSDPVSESEEWKRVKPIIEMALDKGLIVSVDTYRHSVAKLALEMGVHVINDVTGMEDEEMAILTKKYESGLVIMHKKGSFKTMQDNPYYENVILEILDFFYNKIRRAKYYGIEDKIVLDPGIGFGKRIEDNLDIIRFANDFRIGFPLLIGLSRKGFIGKIMEENVEERGLSTVVFNSIALQNGADIIRIHDLDESMKLIKIINEINNF